MCTNEKSTCFGMCKRKPIYMPIHFEHSLCDLNLSVFLETLIVQLCNFLTKDVQMKNRLVSECANENLSRRLFQSNLLEVWEANVKLVH